MIRIHQPFWQMHGLRLVRRNHEMTHIMPLQAGGHHRRSDTFNIVFVYTQLPGMKRWKRKFEIVSNYVLKLLLLKWDADYPDRTDFFNFYPPNPLDPRPIIFKHIIYRLCLNFYNQECKSAFFTPFRQIKQPPSIYADWGVTNTFNSSSGFSRQLYCDQAFQTS